MWFDTTNPIPQPELNFFEKLLQMVLNFID